MTKEQEITKGEYDAIIIETFKRTHKGRSVDDVIVDDSLNFDFLKNSIQKIYGDITKCENPIEVYTSLNHRLMNLRKAGKLGGVTTNRIVIKDNEDYRTAAEIAARQIADAHNTTFDRILCNPELRKEFDHIASEWSPGHSAYEYRRALLKLRKSRKLKPERVKRAIEQLNIRSMKQNLQYYGQNICTIPMQPGVYVFANENGYIYIGQSKNLRRRIDDYLSDRAHNVGFAQYLKKKAGSSREVSIELFVLPMGSKRSLLDALEADLVKTRKPKFNLQLAE